MQLEAGKSSIRREEDPLDVPDSRRAFVAHLHEEVSRSKKDLSRSMDNMQEDMDFAYGRQWKDDPDGLNKYVANITQRQIKQAVASLYAKNPKAVAHRKERLEYRLWDGDPASLQEAIQLAVAAQQTPEILVSPVVQDAVALLEEYQDVKSRNRMLDKVGKTLESVFNYYLNEAQPNFKTMFKQVVRRAKTTGVGYVRVNYQRNFDRNPDNFDKLQDYTKRLANLETLAADIQDGEATMDSAEAEELRLAIKQIESEQEMLVYEGLTFDFPSSLDVIVDSNCTNLQGFVGAEFVAIRYMLHKDTVKQIYGVEVPGNYTAHKSPGEGILSRYARNKPSYMRSSDSKKWKESYVEVFEVFHKPSGLMYTIANGYDDFLAEPEEPVFVEQFFPIFPLVFNNMEHNKELFPPSDVRLMRHQQMEYNSSRQYLKLHRRHGLPRYLTARGMLEDEDKTAVGHASPFTVTDVKMPPGSRLGDLFAPVPVQGVDPNLYNTAHITDDIQRVVGTPDAFIGATTGDTATEISVAAGARQTELGSDIDEVDMVLTQIARACGQILLLEMQEETVMEIAGPGAVWPTFNKQQVSSEVLLEVIAGSSGKPNRAVEIANAERLYPLLFQVPGINPEKVAKDLIMRLDERASLEEFIDRGAPSILALNAMQGAAARMGAGASGDPAAQGNQGQFNQQAPATPGRGLAQTFDVSSGQQA